MVVLSFRLTVGRDSVVKGAVAEDEVVYEVWMLLAPAIDAALLLFKIPVAIYYKENKKKLKSVSMEE